MKNDNKIHKLGVFVLKNYNAQELNTETEITEKKLLYFDQIHYLASTHKKNHICFGIGAKKEEYYLRTSLQKIEDKLPNYFVRVNQSFIINIHKIQGVKNHHTICMQHKEIPIGITYTQKVYDCLKTYFLK